MEGGAEKPWYRGNGHYFSVFTVFQFGLPLGAGYFAAGYPDDVPPLRAPPPDLQPGTDKVLRLLELTAPEGVSRKRVRFTGRDFETLVSNLGPDAARVIASCDHRIEKGPPVRILITFGLSTAGADNPDQALRARMSALVLCKRTWCCTAL